MGRQIVYCQVCGERILEQDLEAGRAVSAQGHNYCSKCRDQAPAEVLAASAPVHPPTPKRTTAPPSTRIERQIDHPRGAAFHHGAPAPRRNNTGLIAGIAVGVAVVGILVVVMATTGGPAPNTTAGSTNTNSGTNPKTSTNQAPITTGDPTKAARETYDQLRNYAIAHSSNPAAVVARIQEDLSKLAGTPFYVDADLLLKEHQRALDQKKVEKIVDELIEKIAATEKSDPNFNSRSTVRRWINDTRPLCQSNPVQVARLDETDRAYQGRFEAAAVARATQILERASRLQREKKFDDALRELDSFPESFADTPSRNDISRMREEVRLAKEGAAVEDTIHGRYTQAINSLQSNVESKENWEKTVRALGETLKELKDEDRLGREGVTSNDYRNMMINCHWVHALYYSRWRNEIEPVLRHLEEAFKSGFNNWDLLDKGIGQTYFENARKDARFAKLVDRWKNRKLLGVTGQPLTAEQAKEAKLAAGLGGLDIRNVGKDTPSEKGGVQVGDWVIGFNGKKLGINSPFDDLRVALEGVVAGKDYDLDIVRDGKTMKLKVRWDK